jgi:hypothetical protein
MSGSVSIHTLSPSHARAETLFIQRRAGHRTSALRSFVDCLTKDDEIKAA